ncbi:MAG: DUF3276 family protein [Bacteroidales bacterium]|nr:DUF3276 family protein [Bacteroidales bacterium]MBR1678420.1 DUF3276 family protein [Bacteroidales bacterium]
MYSEDYERVRSQERNTEDVYSKPVRAGKRTYFFDVKATKGNNDYYLTITESKRRQERDGSFVFDKHKIFLYKEDFEKFAEGLEEAVKYIKENLLKGEPYRQAPQYDEERPSAGKSSFSDVSFEEL